MTIVENRIILEATMAYIESNNEIELAGSAFCSGGRRESFLGGDLWGMGSFGSTALWLKGDNNTDVSIVSCFGLVVVFFEELIAHNPNNVLLTKPTM